MKYLVLIGDGMSDLGRKTPLETAKTPNLDFLAQNGLCGWTSNIPRGMDPGSDVAAISIFGYDPKKYYTGRGPLEAASLGIKLKKDEVCFRCNLVTIKNQSMESFTAHHIKTKEADKLIKLLNKRLAPKGCRFYTGLSYRHLFVVKNKNLAKIKTMPPHDITGRLIGKYLPKNDFIKSLMQKSSDILSKEKGTKANMIWLWGQGMSPHLKKFPKKGAIITAVHLLKGLGRILGLEVINVPGATGYLDTNYKGKAEYALRALKKKDIVFVHVESPDEAGHEGNIQHKIKAIEDFDKHIVGRVLKGIRIHGYSHTRILVLPDHPTPIAKMTHTADPVPFVIYDSENPRAGLSAFSEKAFKKAKVKVRHGHTLLHTCVFTPL